MKVSIAGVIVAEGDELELATYTSLVLELLRLKHEREQAEKDHEEIQTWSKLASMTFEELMKRERDEEE